MLLVRSTPRERLIELARMTAVVRVDRDAEDQGVKGLMTHSSQAGGRQRKKEYRG